MIDLWILIIVNILVIISTSCEIILIFFFIKIKELREYPGNLTLYQCIAQLFIDTHYITIFPEIQERISDRLCNLLGALCMSSYVASWVYICALSLEIYVKLEKPLKKEYRKRMLFYHITAAASFIITFILLSVSNQNGRSELGTCSVQAGSYYEGIYVIPLFSFAPFCLFFTITSYLKLKKQPELKPNIRYHLNIVTAFMIGTMPFTIYDGFNWSILSQSRVQSNSVFGVVIFTQIVIITGSSLGLLLFCARISQKNILRSIFKYKSLNKSDSLSLSVINPLISINPYSHLFEQLENGAKLERILNSLEFVYNNFFSIPKIRKILNANDDDRVWKFASGELSGVIQIRQKLVTSFSAFFRSKRINAKDLKSSFSFEANIDGIEQRAVYEDHSNFCIITKDKKYKIQGLKEEDFLQISKFIKGFLERSSEKNSFLQPIYGLVEVICSDLSIYILVTENTGYQLVNPKEISLINPIEFKIVAGIVEYKFSSKCLDIKINTKDMTDVIRGIYLDANMLSKFMFLQYSLVLIYDETKNNFGLCSKKLVSFDNNIGYLCVKYILGNDSFRFTSCQAYRDDFISELNKLLFTEHFVE